MFLCKLGWRSTALQSAALWLLPCGAFLIPAVAVGCESGSPAPQLSSRVSDWDGGLGEATRDLLLQAQVGGEPRGWMRAAGSRGHWIVGEELSSLSAGLWLRRLKGDTGGAMCLLDTGQRHVWAGVPGVSPTHTCTSVPVADSGPFSSPHTGVNHGLPGPAWLFLRSTSRLVWGGRKQPRQLMSLVSRCLRPLLVGQPWLWPAAGVGACGTESACLPLLPPGPSTVGGSSAASGKWGWTEASVWPWFKLSSQSAALGACLFCALITLIPSIPLLTRRPSTSSPGRVGVTRP